MNHCVYCSNLNRIGLLFCEECGHPLYGRQDATLAAKADPVFDERLAETLWGSSTAHQIVTLHITGAAQPITIRRARRVTIGRMSTDGLTKPDIDLTAYGALEKGVSRTHANIRRYKDRLTLVDLGSSNGTFLNGRQLDPDEEHTLHDGDEIQLGKLVVHIYFKQPHGQDEQ